MVVFGGTAHSSPPVGSLPFSPNASGRNKNVEICHQDSILMHIHLKFYVYYSSNISHCGFTVRIVFSPFFIVFTALGKAGQKQPAQSHNTIFIISYIFLQQTKFCGQTRPNPF